MRIAKKGQVFIPLLTVAAMGALIFFLIQFSETLQVQEDAPLGAYASAIQTAHIESQKGLLFLDESAKMAFDDTVLTLGKQGGYAGQSPCGIFVHNLWNNDQTNIAGCFPNHDEGFKKVFNREHSKLLSVYPNIQFTSAYDYQLIRDSNNANTLTVKGIAQQNIPVPVVFGFVPPETTTCAVSVVPINQIVQGVNCFASDCRLAPDVLDNLKTTVDNLVTQGYTLEITSAYRSYEYQEQLYNSCVGKPCEKDVAKPSCNATHVQGRAIDIKVKYNGQYLETGGIGKGFSYANYQFTRDQIREHIKIENLMCNNGWVRFGHDDQDRDTEGEWWHFEFGTTRHAKATQLKRCALV